MELFRVPAPGGQTGTVTTAGVRAAAAYGAALAREELQPLPQR